MPKQAGETDQQFADRQAAFETARAAGTAGLVGADAYQTIYVTISKEVIDKLYQNLTDNKLLQIQQDVIKLYKQALMVVVEKVFLQQKRQEVHQQLDQTYKHNY